MLLVLDNYDSFTYNLVDALREVNPDWRVVRNDDPEALAHVAQARALVLSPGPGLPETSGVLLEAIRWADGRIPVLGICLGMQALAVAHGGSLRRLETPRHGIPGTVNRMLPTAPLPAHALEAPVGLYHSWAVETVPEDGPWELSAWDASGVPLAMHRRDGKGIAVQFHPESILTPWGREWLQDWARAQIQR